MTERIQKLLAFLREQRHHAFRRDVTWTLAGQFADARTTPVERASSALCAVLAAERPALLPGERLAFTRTVRQLPRLYTEAELTAMRQHHSFAELGVVFNFCCDFATTIALGLDNRRAEAVTRLESTDDRGRAFLRAVIAEIDALLDLAERYRREAEQQGHGETAQLLARVPRHGATTLAEALQFFRILHFTLWCEGNYHNGAGRFDQMFRSYFEHDLAAGRETEESAFEWIEEFFLTFHRDSDLYIGVQQGDNGQSMVLGGCDSDGNSAANGLTELALRASCELKIIEPKINLRVTAGTPMSLFRLGSQLTAAGLGFPQYSNDDVVIPALERWGYTTADARNYVVAACWEFTIPGCGLDVPNIDAISLPAVLLDTLRDSNADNFDEFFSAYTRQLRSAALAIARKYRNFSMRPGPFASLLADGCIERARDISEGGRYNNFGVHGTGIATAVDSLSAIRELVYERKSCSLARLRSALAGNFTNDLELLAEVRNFPPKLGSGDPAAEDLAGKLLTAWANAWNGLKTCRGGCWRPGTGSAMYYIRHSEQLGATPDGRLAGQPFPANYAPSLNVQVRGPVSVIRDFARPELKGVCNGGPLTIELHDSVFLQPDGVDKTAELVALFIRLGGHQLQLNSIDRNRLLAAQKDPEHYRNLIVRVWGWSGYFVELDREFQDHIINRAEMVC